MGATQLSENHADQGRGVCRTQKMEQSCEELLRDCSFAFEPLGYDHPIMQRFFQRQLQCANVSFSYLIYSWMVGCSQFVLDLQYVHEMVASLTNSDLVSL